MSTIQSFPIINSSDGILFTQDANNNVAIAVDETVTVQGNTFNGASELVALDANIALPAVDGSKLTGLTTTQIGGLSTNFADISLSNINSTAKAKIANLAMPSNSYIDLTLGASGSTYTAPADGYYSFAKKPTAIGQQMYIGVESGARFGLHASVLNYLQATIPVKKNDIVQLTQNLGGDTAIWRFTYAQGEV